MVKVMRFCCVLLNRKHFQKPVNDDLDSWLATTPEMIIGKEFHNANKFLNRVFVPWESLDETTRDGTWSLVSRNLCNLQQTGFEIRRSKSRDASESELTAADIEFLAEAEHDGWCRERIALGWRYGPLRDNAARLHPVLISWSALAEDDRNKERTLFRDVARAFCNSGYEIRRSRSG